MRGKKNHSYKIKDSFRFTFYLFTFLSYQAKPMKMKIEDSEWRETKGKRGNNAYYQKENIENSHKSIDPVSTT